MVRKQRSQYHTLQRAPDGALPYGGTLTLLILLLLAAGITSPIIATMRANQRHALATINLVRCKKETIVHALPLGSAGVEVLGKDGDNCTFTVTDEREMGVTRYRCAYPTRMMRLVVWMLPEAGVSWDGSNEHCAKE